MNHLRFLLTLVLAVFSGFVGGVLAIQWQLTPKELIAERVEARRFSMFDENGAYRADLACSGKPQEYVGLMLLDSEDRNRVDLHYQEVLGAELVLRDDIGYAAVHLNDEGVRGHSDDGICWLAPTSLRLFDEDGHMRVILGRTDPEDKGVGEAINREVTSLVFLDKEGKITWSAP